MVGGGDSGMVISPGHSLRALHDSPLGHCVLGLTGRSVSPGSQGTYLRLTVGSPHREKRPAVLLGPPKGLPPRSQGRGPEEESKNPGGSGNQTQDLPVTSRSTLPLDHDGWWVARVTHTPYVEHTHPPPYVSGAHTRGEPNACTIYCLWQTQSPGEFNNSIEFNNSKEFWP